MGDASERVPHIVLLDAGMAAPFQPLPLPLTLTLTA